MAFAKENIPPDELYDTYLSLQTLEGRWGELQNSFISEKIARAKIVQQEVYNLKNILDRVSPEDRKDKDTVTVFDTYNKPFQNTLFQLYQVLSKEERKYLNKFGNFKRDDGKTNTPKQVLHYINIFCQKLFTNKCQRDIEIKKKEHCLYDFPNFHPWTSSPSKEETSKMKTKKDKDDDNDNGYPQ